MWWYHTVRNHSYGTGFGSIVSVTGSNAFAILTESSVI